MRFYLCSFLFCITFPAISAPRYCSKDWVMMRGQFEITQRIEDGVYFAAAVENGSIEYKGKIYTRAIASAPLKPRGFDNHPIFKMHGSLVGRFEIVGTQDVELRSGFNATAVLVEE